MTHPHDTSTPAMSAETVPSEEFVLVPKAQWADAYKAFVGAFDTAIDRRKRPDEYALDARIRLREFNEAVQGTLSASRLAKEGGEAAERLHSTCTMGVGCETHGVCFADAHGQPDQCASLPQPSPALAKGGDAVRERIARALNGVLGSEEDEHPRRHPAQNSSEKPTEVWWTQWLEAADAVIAALSTPTEGPASQTEGMGGDADRDRLPAGHIVLEQADMMDGSGRVAQTVSIGPEGAPGSVEYQRIVHADEAYGAVE